MKEQNWKLEKMLIDFTQSEQQRENEHNNKNRASSLCDNNERSNIYYMGVQRSERLWLKENSKK